MLVFLIDNIFVQFGGRVFQLATGIPTGAYCARLLVDLFIHTFQELSLEKKKVMQPKP